MVGFWENLPKPKRSSSESYLNVKESLEGLFVTAKLYFCGYFTIILEPILKKMSDR